MPSGNFSFCREAMDEASAKVPHSGRLGIDEGRRVTITTAAAMMVLPTNSRADQGRLVMSSLLAHGRDSTDTRGYRGIDQGPRQLYLWVRKSGGRCPSPALQGVDGAQDWDVSGRFGRPAI